MSAPIAWFPFYGEDFYDSTTVDLADGEADGLYLNLLWYQWRKGSIPKDPAAIARVVHGKFGKRFKKTWPQIEACFPVVGESRQNPRCAAEREKAVKLLDAKSRGAFSANQIKREKRAHSATHSETDSVTDSVTDSDAKPAENGAQSDRTSNSRQFKSSSNSSGGAAAPPSVEPQLSRSMSRSESADAQALVRAYFEAAYQRVYGKQYCFAGGRDGAALKLVVEKRANGDVAECCERIDVMFASSHWVETGADIGSLLAGWSKHVRPICAPTGTSRAAASNDAATAHTRAVLEAMGGAGAPSEPREAEVVEGRVA